ncbi:3'-5' exonuclease [Novimethylophilus kurashikiensis]|uniref:3'-5' exonuclease n=1 Tax=Novimethylophilus kurashikiensis TaxID=1825523 RepID=A0A2R5FAF5_9PROT|nr:hypothetical protein [Novimethylophilus kurashikiensis]GBG15210.1 3'-5' exonuclease [Novimethylophilus kurashikiensis]
MSDQQAVPGQMAKMKPNQAYIKGEIDGVRKYDSDWYTRVKVPQERGDYRFAYIEIRSKQKIGAMGEEFAGLVDVAGMRNDFELKNGPNAGEIVRSATNWLTIAE